jgi:hypothetical protein
MTRRSLLVFELSESCSPIIVSFRLRSICENKNGYRFIQRCDISFLDPVDLILCWRTENCSH